MPFWNRAMPVPTPQAPTPYDPTHVWVSGPNGDVLTNILTGKPAAPGEKIPVPAGVPVATFANSIPVVAHINPITPVVPAPIKKEPAMSLGSVEKEVLSVLETVAKDTEKVLAVAVKYAPPVEALVAILLPGAGPAAVAAGTALTMIQNAVIEVEQKSSALPTGLTDAQKTADILALIGPAVTSVLASEKITAGSAEITNLINAVRAILTVAPAAV